MRTVAALFVDPKGCYAGLEGVDPWGEERDARLYDGPHPIVGHAPGLSRRAPRHGSNRRPAAGGGLA
jgi:hypothetical protein